MTRSTAAKIREEARRAVQHMTPANKRNAHGFLRGWFTHIVTTNHPELEPFRADFLAAALRLAGQKVTNGKT